MRNIVQVHDPDARLVGADAHKIGQLLGGDGLHHVALGHLGDGGRPHLASVDQVLHRCFAAVLQLHGNLGAMAVHPLGDAAQTGDEVIARDADLVGLTSAVRERNRAHAHGEQAGTALGARLVIGLDALAAVPVGLGKVRAHGGHDDAVAQFERANAPRLQKGGVGVGHGVKKWF